MSRIIVALLVLLACAPLAAATREISGTTPGGANFLIDVPDGWSPGGPLIIVNHGYNFEFDPTPSLGPLKDLWLSQGYAVAASSFRQRGWALFTALDDNAELVARFTVEFGPPGALIATGGSMGGLISLKMLDDPRFARLTGVYALCAPANAYGAWDSAFDLRLAYDAVCDGVTGGSLPRGDQPLPWALNLDDIPANLSDIENAPEVIRTLLPVTICTGLGLNESLRFNFQKDNLAKLMTYAQVDDEEFFTTQLGYAIYGLSDVVRSPDKLGGRNPFDSRYTGAFAGSSVEIDARIPRIAPDVFARYDFGRASSPARIQNQLFGGANQVPVVSLFTSRDELVRTYHADAIHGARTIKVRIDEPAPSHCGFTDAEAAGGWSALTQVMAGAPVPDGAPAQAQVVKSACEQALALGAAGPCRIDPTMTNQPSAGAPRPRLADDAMVGLGTSGLWWDPARSGEGVLLEVLTDNRALAAWFTYPPLAAGGLQQWMLGTGQWVGNGATITPLIAAQGARFGAAFDPAAVQRTNWGSMTFALDRLIGLRQFGRMRYAGPTAFGAGDQAFEQLTPMIYAGGLEFDPPLPTEQGYLGTFWNPARSGEGVMLTQDWPSRQAAVGVLAPLVFALWFTYDLDGHPLWLYGDVSGTRGQYQVTFLRPVGANFGAAFDPHVVVRAPWGTATLTFTGSCDRFTLDYTSTQPGFGSGSLELQRLSAPAGTIGTCPAP